MRILLDTNIISELMRPLPSPKVLAWIAMQPRDMLCTASIVQTEIFYGIAMLPEGRRKAALASAAEAMFSEDFAGAILPYDGRYAHHYAHLVMSRRAAGSPIEAFDALIAATALGAGTTLATRDTGGFKGCGVEIINPFQD